MVQLGTCKVALEEGCTRLNLFLAWQKHQNIPSRGVFFALGVGEKMNLENSLHRCIKIVGLNLLGCKNGYRMASASHFDDGGTFRVQ